MLLCGLRVANKCIWGSIVVAVFVVGLVFVSVAMVSLLACDMFVVVAGVLSIGAVCIAHCCCIMWLS